MDNFEENIPNTESEMQEEVRSEDFFHAGNSDIVDEIFSRIKENLENIDESECLSFSDSDIEALSNFFLSKYKIDKPVELPDVQVQTAVKKYVIHVDPENVDFMEHLSINERRRIINKILKEQAIYTAQELKASQRKKKITHLIIFAFTFMLAFPLFFILFTTAAKMTIDTYASTKASISKLYKENGKIKRIK